MEELIGLKQKIKKWEHAFLAKEKRHPTREDIDANSTGIKEDYVRYNLLKQRQSKPDDIKIKEKIPEWKKLSTKNFSFERKTNVNTETPPSSVVECANEEENNITALRMVRVHKDPSTQQDDVTTPRLPQHYNLVLKQKSGLMYRRSISSDWIERHSTHDDVISDGPDPSRGESDHTASRCEILNESTLFNKLYEKETVNDDSQHLQLDIEDLILNSSVQTELDELVVNKVDRKLEDTTLSGVMASLSNEEVVTEAVRTDDHIWVSEDLADSSEPIELKEDTIKKPIPKSKLKLTPLKSFRLPPRYTPTLQPPSAGETESAGKTEESETSSGQKRSCKSTLPSSKRAKLNTSVSNNFVRLDMKRKHYKAKGRGMSAKNYKRKMFHKKQFENDSGGVPRGRGGGGAGGRSTRCFKCGEAGHWARNCTQRVAESDLGKFAGETCSYQDAQEDDGPEVVESPLPTLAEAALMSQGRTLFDIRQENGVADPIFPDDTHTLCEGEGAVAREQVDPLFPSDTSQQEVDKKLKRALKELKHAGFREGQKEAVTRILRGESTMVLLGTGGGKSLCYQLPAMLYAQREVCVVLVISPLVSLMEDQCLNMPAAISATCLHTNQTAKQREKILVAIKENKFSVILLSPEMLASQEKGVNEVFSLLPPIPFVCIDEVHCLSQWSHNFRPSYMRLCKVIRERFGVKCILALTATATRRTVSDLMTRLGIGEEEGVIKGPILPENLQLSVSRAKDRDRALIELFQSDRFSSLSPIIVYCTRQKETERVAQMLRTHIADLTGSHSNTSLSTVAECYHAGMSAQRRNQVQKGFMNGKVRIVAATLAFGMGLNKSDVRAIVHYNMPSSCENYVQEVGRAGRDGVTSYCHAFLDTDDSDLCELKKHAYANGMDGESLQKLVDSLFPACECVGACKGHVVGVSVDRSVMEFDIPEGSLSTLLCYCEEKGWLHLLRQQYDACNVKCYGGEKQLRKLAEKMPVVAAAVALQDSSEAVKQGCVNVTISAVSRRMGWEYATMKRELGSLSYNDRETGGRQRSSVIVEMTGLSHLFRIFHRDDNKREDVVRFLGEQIEEAEKQTLIKLSVFSQMLINAAENSTQTLFREEIRSYFEDDVTRSLPPSQTSASLIPRLRQDIGGFITAHSDSKLTGRVIARILHGISSPNYPAYMWGSTMYWRRHMEVDFHLIRKLAEKELERF